MAAYVRRPPAGLGLLELLLAIVVGALALAGVLLLFGHADAEQKSTETLAEMQDMIAVIHQIYASAGSTAYKGLDIPTLYNSGLMPRKEFASETVIQFPDGFITSIDGASSVGDTDNVVNFWIQGVSRAGCLLLGSANMGAEIEDRNVNGYDYGTGQYSPDELTTEGWCKDGNVNEVGFNVY